MKPGDGADPMPHPQAGGNGLRPRGAEKTPAERAAEAVEQIPAEIFPAAEAEYPSLEAKAAWGERA